MKVDSKVRATLARVMREVKSEFVLDILASALEVETPPIEKIVRNMARNFDEITYRDVSQAVTALLQYTPEYADRWIDALIEPFVSHQRMDLTYSVAYREGVLPGIFRGVIELANQNAWNDSDHDDRNFVKKIACVIQGEGRLIKEMVKPQTYFLGALENAVRDYCSVFLMYTQVHSIIEQVLTYQAGKDKDDFHPVGRTILDAMAYARFRQLNTGARMEVIHRGMAPHEESREPLRLCIFKGTDQSSPREQLYYAVAENRDQGLEHLKREIPSFQSSIQYTPRDANLGAAGHLFNDND